MPRKRVLRALIILRLLIATVKIASAGEACSTLTAADVQKITGTQVHNVLRESKPGGGGRCANFAKSDGNLYLGVSQLTSESDYKKAVASVPESVYPNREKLSGVGDEGVLMKDSTGLIRYLVARKGNHGVILFPLRKGPSDEELKKLAAAALSH